MKHLPHYKKEERPWGSFLRFTLNQPSTVKILEVKSGEEFSLQTHKKRSEFWRILSGEGVAIIGDEKHEVVAGDELFIPPETKHRMTGGGEGVTFLEISFGDFNEEDITRLTDRYGREVTPEQ